MSKSWRTALAVGALIAVFAATSAGAAKFITGGDIKNGSIGLKDLSRAAKRGLKGHTGPAGATGAVGPQGPAGAQGPAGPSAISTSVRTGFFDALPEGFADGEVRCPAGMTAIGGSVSTGGLVPVYDAPSIDGGGWVGSAYNPDPSETFSILVVAICAPGSAQVQTNSVHAQAKLKAAALAEHAN
jgi:hypothetical protein